jgi:Wzt C-terminal domain
VDDGPPDRVLDYYNALIAKREATTQILQAENRTGARSGTFEAKLIEIDLLDREGRPVRGFTVGERARVCCRVHFATRLRSPTVGVLIRDRLGNDVFGTNTYHAAPIDEAFEAGDELEVEFEIDLNLGVGTYTSRWPCIATPPTWSTTTIGGTRSLRSRCCPVLRHSSSVRRGFPCGCMSVPAARASSRGETTSGG